MLSALLFVLGFLYFEILPSEQDCPRNHASFHEFSVESIASGFDRKAALQVILTLFMKVEWRLKLRGSLNSIVVFMWAMLCLGFLQMPACIPANMIFAASYRRSNTTVHVTIFHVHRSVAMMGYYGLGGRKCSVFDRLVMNIAFGGGGMIFLHTV